MAADPVVVEVDTPRGAARVHRHPADPPARGSVVLGHGAGGRGFSSDLRLIAERLPPAGWTVVLVEQPWMVAGKRVATPPRTLDEAWRPVLANLTSGPEALPRPLVVGGRSAGARVACRTAGEVGADAVLALAFPLAPPGRPERSRATELAAATGLGLPTWVLQGERDAFGGPEQVRAVIGEPGRVVAVPGGHSAPARPTALVDAVLEVLGSLGGA